ncbi:MAG: Gfo/Idh/MocA family oxidoreductase [Oscillospiraceae bacterium]|nr:Gfo/Idh/MocA family oxidoreductase [Oscillospiraceae bacterium]
MFKVGLIGCGGISHSHVDAASFVEDVKITAAADISEKNLAEICEKTGATGYTDYKEMVKNEELDFVIISLPHALHGEATCFCAKAGVDVVLEKPMGIDSKDCKKMISVCKKAGVMLWIAHPQRYATHNIIAKELIDSGKLGTLVSLDETRNCNYFSESRPRWFLTKKMSGGGIMFNLGAHTLDKLKFFTDGSEIVFATGSVHLRDGFDCEDSVCGFAKTANGVSCSLNLVAHTPAIKYDTVLYLTEGEIRIDSNHGEISYCGRDGVFETATREPVSSFILQLEDIVRALKSDKKPTVSAEYGADIIRAIKRIYREEK